jgi:hypothetical protein
MAFRKMVTEIVEQWSTKVDLQFLADKKGNKVRGALLYVHGTRGDSHRLEKHIQKTEVLWADAMPSGHEFPESHTMRPYGPLRKAKDKAA